jgi:RecF/RecN/SMC N terminal domain
VIRVESLEIIEFRGIRKLTLNFNGENFAVGGPNGTGKSGVVDAIEFVFTGNVSRLSGEGRGDVSLKQHGPHVDKRNDPDKARVRATISIPSLKKSVLIERTIKAPHKLTIIPEEADVLAVLKQLETHSEIVLSRRELIRYVLATPGKRAEEIQALLHLSEIEQVRVGLQKIANTCDKQVKPLADAADEARANLLRALNLSGFTSEKILAAANEQRTILALPALPELTATTSLKDGMAAPKLGTPVRIPKAQALADIKAYNEALDEILSKNTSEVISEALKDLNSLASDPAISLGVKQERFYSLGMDLLHAAECPFCDTSWDLRELQKHIKGKIDRLKSVAQKRAAAEKKILPLIAILNKVESVLESVSAHADKAEPRIATPKLRDCSNACRTLANTLREFLPVAESINALKAMANVPQSVCDEIATLEKAVSVLPDSTKQDAARDYLTLAQERLEVWREAMRKQNAAKDRAKRARQVFDIYAKTSDEVLAALYAEVEKDFAALYGFVNRDDEDAFEAKLIPSLGKLGFDVDFYGRGFFPPGAYHSEGHQDGMGLCLYLALMRHLYGAEFTFAVLDDVLMSVDAGHRREVCALMKREFPNTQFVVTTHDPIWLRHMKTEGLIGSGSAVQFRCWNVDEGPTSWDDRDVWQEIDDDLAKDDVRSAAALLRHYLEYVSGELCHRLRAAVEYRGDARYQLGELLPAAVLRLRKLFKRAKEAASSWNQRELVEQLGARAAAFSEVVNKSKVEEWQVNVALHFNSWDNLEKGDFTPVAKAFRDLLEAFRCPDCGGFLRVSPEREAIEALRCTCGKVNINLCPKSPKEKD